MGCDFSVIYVVCCHILPKKPSKNPQQAFLLLLLFPSFFPVMRKASATLLGTNVVAYLPFFALNQPKQRRLRLYQAFQVDANQIFHLAEKPVEGGRGRGQRPLWRVQQACTRCSCVYLLHLQKAKKIKSRIYDDTISAALWSK